MHCTNPSDCPAPNDHPLHGAQVTSGGAGRTSHRVAHGAFQLLDVEGPKAGVDAVVAQVGALAWTVGPGSGAVRVGELSFAFSHPDHPFEQQFVVVLSSDTDPQAVGLLEALLESVCQFKEAAGTIENPKAQQGEAAAAGALATEPPAAAAPPPAAGTVAIAAAPLAAAPQYGSVAAQRVQRMAISASSGIMLAAMRATEAMQCASDKLRQGPATSQPLELSPGFVRRMEGTARAAKWASRATHKVGKGLGWLGSRALGGALWVFGLNRPLRPGEQPGVVSATAVGISEVWEALEQAGYLVLTSARDSAAAVAAHRYGEQAGAATHHGMNAAVYSGDTLTNLSGRAAAREGAKAVGRDVLRRMARQA